MATHLLTSLQTLFSNYKSDNIPRLSAALSYYATFALTPVLVICITFAGLVFGNNTVKNELLSQISNTIGESSASQVDIMVTSATQTPTGLFASLFSVGILLFVAAGLFSELKNGFDTIWGVKPKIGTSIMLYLLETFFSFAMVFGIVFLLLISLIINTLILAFQKYLAAYSGQWGSIIYFLNHILSLAIVTALFAMLFKLLPDVRIRWPEVWGSALLTAIFFSFGKLVLEVYLSKSNFASAYGAAGSLVMILVWVYYSAQILYIGAEMTKVNVLERRKVQPTKNAEFIH